MTPESFEPRIIAFLCTWCSYRAADEVGRARRPYPAAIKIVRVPCSGRVDPQWILAALERGADGVIIVGCPKGNCHYKSGNLQALKRFALLRRLLQEMGIDTTRVRQDWVGAGDGEKLLSLFCGMVEDVRAKGPLAAL